MRIWKRWPAITPEYFSVPDLQSLPPLVCLAVFFGLFAFVNFFYMPRFIDGDIYADMELAREIWRKKALFPDNWVYGNQYYTVATPVAASNFSTTRLR